MPALRSRDERSLTVTQSLRPSKLRARPKRPATCAGPLSVPWLPVPEASNAVPPARSSKPHAPTSFGVGVKTGSPRIEGGAGESVGGSGEGDGLGVGEADALGLGDGD